MTPSAAPAYLCHPPSLATSQAERRGFAARLQTARSCQRLPTGVPFSGNIGGNSEGSSQRRPARMSFRRLGRLAAFP
jgi:hypothetical protein